jgi:ketosteroid isomerase-like protein
MSHQNVDVVRAYFHAREESGREGVFDFLASDVEWQARADLPDVETYTGHDGVRTFFGRFSSVVEDMWFRPREFILAGEQVVVPLLWGGRGRGSGVEFEEGETWVFTVRDGAIVRVTEYTSKQAALDAVGPQE